MNINLRVNVKGGITTLRRLRDPRDGNVYYFRKIAGLWWCVENLKYLPSGVELSPVASGSTDQPHYYVYNHTGGVFTEEDKKTNTNYNIYGVLYNWKAAMDACPPGTHLPTDEEWYRLESFLTGEGKTCNKSRNGSYDCDPAGTKLKGWGIATGTNSSGFTALAGGFRSEVYGVFRNLGDSAHFWSSTESSPGSTTAWRRYLSTSYAAVNRYSSSKAYGDSVRCVLDD